MEELRYVEVPGSVTHELPPLLVRGVPDDAQPREQLVSAATEIVESEDLLPEETPGSTRMLHLAAHLTDQYLGLLTHWQWGDSVLEWIRQCEITFDANDALRPLLQVQVWPHAGRSSFVELLLRKQVETHGVALDQAVGTRRPSAPAPDRLLLESVSVLFEIVVGRLRLPDVGAHEGGSRGPVPAQSLSLRSTGNVSGPADGYHRD